MAEPMVKATPVNSLANYIRQQLGDQRTNEIAAGLTPGATHWFSGHLMAHEQVPLAAVNELTTRAAEAAARPLPEFAHAAGRHAAEQGLRSVYKFIMVLMSPESVLKTAPLMWKKVYDTGRMEVSTGDQQARITVHDFPAHAAGCGRITGWFEVIGEKSADGMSVIHDRCRTRGAGECSWHFVWTK